MSEPSHYLLEPGPTRHPTVTHKIPSELTGFNSSVFLHVDHTDAGEILGVRLSQRWKDGSTLDRLLHAIGDSATDIVRQIQRGAS